MTTFHATAEILSDIKVCPIRGRVQNSCRHASGHHHASNRTMSAKNLPKLSLTNRSDAFCSKVVWKKVGTLKNQVGCRECRVGKSFMLN